MNALCPPPTGSCAPTFSFIVKVFTASGLYLPSPGLISVKVRCIGGGGGSGSAGPVPSVQYLLGGGGGGSGGYSEKTLAAALVVGGVNVTIGLGGAAGGAGAGSGQIINGSGGAGTATSFGALCVANGGSGGAGNNANQLAGQNGSSGPGAVPGFGDLALPGGDGGPGAYEYMQAAQTGGISYAGRGGSVFGTGLAAFGGWAGQFANGSVRDFNTGEGATGAFISEIGGGPLAGAPGSSGICIAEEFVGPPMPTWSCAPSCGCGGARVNAGWCCDCGGWQG